MEVTKSRIFKSSFLQMIQEDVTAASAGMGTTGDQFSSDSYAPKDTRMPTVLGVKRAKKKTKPKLPIQRRSNIGM